MKTAVVLLTLIAGLAFAAGPANTPGMVDRTTDRDPAAPARAPYGAFSTLMDPPETVWTRPVSYSAYCVGVTDVQDSLMWVSAGQTALKIYRINIADPSRPLVDSFAQTGGPSGWGIRDMAYKEATDEVFAGFDGQRFHVYNATTLVPNGTYTVTGYSGTVRGFGYHPVEDSCWTCNFTTSPMTKFSITGTNGHQVRAAAQMSSAYGLAWDATNSCFWVTMAGGAGASPFWKMTYPGYTVPDSFNPPGWDLGGGVEMWRGDTFMLAVEQADPDRVWCFRMITGGGAAHDVALSEIVRPPSTMNQGSVVPKAMVRNRGSNPEGNFPVTCWIDSAGTRVYNQTATYVGPLAPGATDSIVMPVAWNSGPAGSQYTVTFFTALTGDENPANDTAVGQTTISGAVFADTIVVKRIPLFAPTIDGVIEPGEWAASIWYDISDIAGRGGSPYPPGSNFAYYMYDDNFMYYAMDCPNYTGRTNYDQFGPYMDEDRSGTWSTDSSEGNHWVEYVGSDSLVYRALLSTAPAVWRMPGQCPGCVSASSTRSGHLQFEAKIPFGTRKGDYTVDPGDTVKYFQYTAVGGGSQFIGWWPQSLQMAQWPNPAYYGIMWFDPNTGVEEGRVASVPYALYRVSNPVRNSAGISYYLGRRSEVSLGVYDVTGKLIKTLENGTFEPGVRNLTWNRTSDSGSRVASGTYFYRLTVDGKSVSAKAVVLE
ncbi:MAG: FlgD immunoglobulin-like domain containing protein [candidate division WOR-3 bacterium]